MIHPPRNCMAGVVRCEPLLKSCLTILHSYFEKLSWMGDGGAIHPPCNCMPDTGIFQGQ